MLSLFVMVIFKIRTLPDLLIGECLCSQVLVGAVGKPPLHANRPYNGMIELLRYVGGAFLEGFHVGVHEVHVALREVLFQAALEGFQ